MAKKTWRMSKFVMGKDASCERVYTSPSGTRTAISVSVEDLRKEFETMKSALMTAEAAGLLPDTNLDAGETNVFGVGNFQIGQIEHGAMHLVSIETLDQAMFRFIVDRGTATRIVEESRKLFGTGDGN